MYIQLNYEKKKSFKNKKKRYNIIRNNDYSKIHSKNWLFLFKKVYLIICNYSGKT